MDVDAKGPTLAEGMASTLAADPAPAPATLGKYRLDRVLGTGGMGVVWAAYDPDLERAVAIKVLRDAGDPALRTRLLREARAMARLKHPNVVVVHEVGTDANRDYIVMDLVDGGDLAAWLATKPARDDVLTALVAAGRGLAAAHDAGLIHRDFKPHNVLRGTDGRIYVTDFGLARGQLDPVGELELVTPTPTPAPAPASGGGLASGSHPRARPLDSVLDSELTQTGMLIGTPAYMAPEQFTGAAPDPRSDQFAFCVAAWEGLAGARPFAGDSLDALKSAMRHGVSATAGDLPPPLRSILTRGLAVDPAARWPDMHALLTALGGAGAAASAPPGRRWWPIAAIAAVGVPATGGGAPALLGSGSHGAMCEPAQEAFASAWSAARRAEIEKQPHNEELIGAFTIMSELQHKWITAYDAACAAPPTAQSHEHISCLLEVRDEVAQATKEMATAGSDADLQIGELAQLIGSVKQCGKP